MKTLVFTLCWGTAWERYGKNFVESFDRYWLPAVDLALITDQPHPMPRGTMIDLDAIEGVREFRARWKGSRRATGWEPLAGMKRDERGYSWRMDAAKWMPQALAPIGGLLLVQDGDILCWFDADVVTTSLVPVNWVEMLLDDHDVAMLQRGSYHSEIGFYAIRVSARTRQLLLRFADFYRTDAVFGLKEWHSAYVFDRALEMFPGLTINNLNRENGKGHVWPKTRLAGHTEHRKGNRKDKR